MSSWLKDPNGFGRGKRTRSRNRRKAECHSSLNRGGPDVVDAR